MFYSSNVVTLASRASIFVTASLSAAVSKGTN